jgi:hypothetical protein
MKKLGFLGTALFFSCPLPAQKANTEELEKFAQLKAYDRITVTLVKGNENKLVITGDGEDKVEVDNDRGIA